MNRTWVGAASPLGPRRTAPCSAPRGLLPQKARHVAGHRGIGGVGQAQFLHAHAALPGGHLAAGHLRQEAFRQHALDIGAFQRGLDGPADQSGALAQNRDRLLLGLRPRLQQFLLGNAAVGPQRHVLARIQARALFGEPLRHGAGQGQVDVIAAQQDVIAHRDAVEREFPGLLGHRDQGEVGGAAADIHHQDQVAHLHALAPVRVALDPGVEGRLRLLQQSDVAVAGLFGGFERQFARHRIEGRGHGDQHLLFGERRVRHLRVPGLAQVLQVAAAGLHRRDFLHAIGRAEGQQRTGAVHAGMREPAFGAGDQASGILHAAFLRQASHHVAALRVPGQCQRPLRKIAGAGQVQEGGQQVLVADFAGIGQLRDGEQLHVRRSERVGAGEDLRVGECRVGGTEVDTDDVSGFSCFLTQFRFPRER